MSDSSKRLEGARFAAHNAEVDAVWTAYRAEKPIRVPMILGVNTRYTTFGHPANPDGITLQECFENPDKMLQRQLEHLDWCAHHLMQDAPMGLPDKWGVYPEFQNVYEAAMWGCPIRYFDYQVPDTDPIFTGEEGKRRFLEAPRPDPFENPFSRHAWAMHDTMKAKEVSGFEYNGRPISVGAPSGLGTDGPFTMCCNLRGTTDFCEDLLLEPQAAQAMLEKATTFIIERIQAWRKRLGQPLKTQGWGFADDSIALVSTDEYVRSVLPHHQILIEAFSEGGPNSIHLCGDATRHFPTLQRELNIQSFDTGFPVDFGSLRQVLGPGCEVLGGPSTPFLKMASLEDVRTETRRVLESGIAEGGRFILREGNNLPPDVSPEKCAAMYETVREFGRYGVVA
ncbi:MAG: hypothetical protein HZC36_16060 [Armatimonadetes bacterium]|nr:hypothetical protein [Armatimonadota bacterium]